MVAASLTAISGGSDMASGALNNAFTDAEVGLAASEIDSAGDDSGDSSGGGGDDSGDSSGGGGDDSGDSSDAGGDSGSAPGTGTMSYWESTPGAWPVTSLTIAGTSYDQDGLIDILDTNGNNKPTSMAKQLIAAELNVLDGNSSSCINTEIDAAHEWLGDFPIGTSGGSVNSAWSSTGEALTEALETYNLGNATPRN